MQTVLAFIIVLGVLIFVHELGHFVTAKLAGIAVLRFSIGLGPRVWGVRYGETEYVISALPLGGYVRMAGMGEEEALERLEGGADEDIDVPPERRFNAKSIPVRATVISAGVIMNFLFAVVAFAGIAYQVGAFQPLVGRVFQSSPAAEAGMRAGDLIVAVDGREVDRSDQFARYVQEHAGEEVILQVRRDDRRLTVSTRVGRVVHTNAEGDTVSYQGIGIQWDTIAGRRPLSVGASLAAGTREAVGWSTLIVDFIGDLVTGGASARELGGPILIGQLSGQAARAGLRTLVHFMAVLSVNLAVLNLLPIPILDGGYLVFLTIEAIRGQAVSAETRIRWSQLGFIFILALMVWVITSDVLRLAGK